MQPGPGTGAHVHLMLNTAVENPTTQPGQRPIEVLFVLLTDSLALDWAGPAEALRMANQALQAQGLPPRFVLRYVGPTPETRSSVGLQLSGLEPLPNTLPEPAWVVLVGQPGTTIPVQSVRGCALLRSASRLPGWALT